MGKEVSFNIRLDDNGTFKKVTMNAKELGNAIRKVEDEAEKAKRGVLTWSEASQAIDVLQNTIGELQNMISDLTSAYQVQLVAETQLNTIMRQRMHASDGEIQSIKDLCSAQQQLGVVGDEVQLSGAQQMATFLQNKQSLDVLIPAMNNLIAQQEGLNASTSGAVSIGNMMGKAMQGQVEVLQRVGITFTDAQKQVLQFGTESERAAMLAQVITDNVGNMNAELAKTDGGKQKQLENSFGDIKEQLGGLVQGIAPAITMISQLVVAGSGVVKLATSLYASYKAVCTLTSSTQLLTRAKVGAVAVGRVMTAVMRGESVSATTAAVATRSLSVAVKSLLVSTGVGIAIVALGEAISYLSQSSAEAADNVQQLGAAEQQSQAARRQEAQDIAQVRTQMDMSIATLKAFKGGEKEEHALVQKMNQTYGQTIGYYSTVDQWYTALTANSEAYCNQMINEIRLRNLANKAAELQAKQREIKYNDDGSLKRYSKKRQTRTITHVGGSDPNAPDITTETIEVKGTSALEKANAQFTTLYRQEVAVKKEMQEIINTAAKPIKHTKGYSSTMPTFPSGKPTTPPPSPTTTTTPTTPDPLEGSIDYYEKEIAELRKKISATADEGAAAILQKELEQKETALKDLKIRIGIEKPEPKEAKTALQQLQDQLQVAQQDFDNAVDVEAKVKAHAKVVALQQQIDETTNGKLTISADVEPQYIEQGSKADKRQSYQNAQNRASRIQQDYEIGLIGKDEAQKQIDELNKQIASMSKGLKPIEIDLDTKSFDKVFGDIKSGWGSVEGVGNGIQGISDALEENGDAWKQITGVIGGALEVADGIAGIVKLIDMLTSSTEAETAATAVNTAITASNTGVSAANTATKSGEAVANATASGAKLPFPANLVAIAAGVAAVVGALGMISGAFADGGIVGGSSWSGDKLMARVNSGEMILNGAQQSRLFAIANGATVYGAASGVGRGLVEGVKVGPEIERLRAVVVKDENRLGGISLRLRGSDLVGVIANETRGNRRRSNIRI